MSIRVQGKTDTGNTIQDAFVHTEISIHVWEGLTLFLADPVLSGETR